MNELDILADNAGIAIEVPPPELVTQDGYRLRVLQVRGIRRQEIAAENCRHAEILEGISRKVNGIQVFRHITSGDDEVPPVHRDHVFHRTRLTKLANLGPGKTWSTFVATLVDGIDLADPVETGIGPGVEDRTVDYAEN